MRALVDNILLRLDSARLDADLAAGQSPERSPSHAARARRLVAPPMRQRLAKNWEHLLSISRAPTRGVSNRAPVCRERTRRAEPEICQLITALRATGPIPARGVAIASRLLADGRGPVYNPKSPEDLTAAVALAVEQLDPSLPLAFDLVEPVRG